MEPIFQSLETPWQRIYFDLSGMGEDARTPLDYWHRSDTQCDPYQQVIQLYQNIRKLLRASQTRLNKGISTSPGLHRNNLKPLKRGKSNFAINRTFRLLI